jgi:hypothetical protein
VTPVDAGAPLTKREARALDVKVRAAAAKVITDAGKLAPLLEQAERGQINAALGCSMRAWFSDAVRIDRKTLRALVPAGGAPITTTT